MKNAKRMEDFIPKHNEIITCTAPLTLPKRTSVSSTTIDDFPFGGGPSGTITIEVWEDKACPGFDPTCSVISLLMKIPTSTQLEYHPNPGVQYDGKCIRSYLPNNLDGCMLLTRIKFAFEHGYVIKIGTSVTTQKENQSIFTDIPNKTSLNGGKFGFPDDQYIKTANRQMDKYNIPDAENCLAYYEPKKRVASLPLSPSLTNGSRSSFGSDTDLPSVPFQPLPPPLQPSPAQPLPPVHNEIVTCTAPTRLADFATSSQFPFGGGPSGTVTMKVLKDGTCPGFQPPCFGDIVRLEYSCSNTTRISSISGHTLWWETNYYLFTK